MRAAYIGAAVIMVSKRPPLADYLIDAPKATVAKRVAQTVEQQIAIARQWSAATAGAESSPQHR